jgi:hypothetical protein
MPPKKRFKFQSKKPSKTSSSTGASVDVLNVEIIQVWSNIFLFI